MSDSDIDKAVKEAAEFEAQDKKRKEAIDVKNEADSLIFQTEKTPNTLPIILASYDISGNTKTKIKATKNCNAYGNAKSHFLVL